MYWYIVKDDMMINKLYPNDHSLNKEEFNEHNSINDDKKIFVPLEKKHELVCIKCIKQ